MSMLGFKKILGGLIDNQSVYFSSHPKKREANAKQIFFKIFFLDPNAFWTW
jgi:hypothetical protein